MGGGIFDAEQICAAHSIPGYREGSADRCAGSICSGDMEAVAQIDSRNEKGERGKEPTKLKVKNRGIYSSYSDYGLLCISNRPSYTFKNCLMGLIKSLLVCVPLLFSLSSSAQIIEDPTTWTYEVKKKSATEYQLIFHVELKSGWHIWSLKPGGDGYQIVPSFTFDKNAKVKMKGAIAEKGKPTTTAMEGVDGKVTYMSGKVDYVQNVVVTGGGKITGKHEYQVCNDKLCLAPKEKNFSFEIK